MTGAAWLAAIAAYDEAVRIQPEVAGLYGARGTAYMYAGRHDEALADYPMAIEIAPNNAGHWRRRAHAYTIAPTPEPQKGIDDASGAIELDPHHPMGYGHRAIALTQLPTADWERALTDMNRHIELFPDHDPEAHRFRASIHEKLGNYAEAENTAGWPGRAESENRRSQRPPTATTPDCRLHPTLPPGGVWTLAFAGVTGR